MTVLSQERLEKEIAIGEIETEKGKNQEVTLVRVGDTRWGSHHGTITSLIKLFPEVLKVLHFVKEDGNTLVNRETTSDLITYFKTLDFVFYLYLLHILGITDVLSRHFQKKDQPILEAVSLVKGTIRALKQTRYNARKSQERLEKEIAIGEIETEKGKNQEVTLVRVGDTRWGSHHGTITSLIKLFPEVLKVLHFVKEDGNTLVNRETTSDLITYFKTLDFVFYLYLLHILGITNVLSCHFQKKDQPILEVVSLVKGTIRALKQTRFSFTLEECNFIL
ncbi:zinc finger MYM-type protein 1-like protein [Tanacetum coccineum]|uniref:Zinc finger MYM-type protein 1-like protein n=1 Tax=Tanacetum coccineum TaxID=301880 RepID=A0ABQ5ER46_9ASTR